MRIFCFATALVAGLFGLPRTSFAQDEGQPTPKAPVVEINRDLTKPPQAKPHTHGDGEHHHHGDGEQHHGDDHHHHHPPTETRAQRFLTDRESQVDLRLTDEDDSFFFVVYGDRTGGPAEGVKVLDQAVKETNLLDPDLVMTVGDLIQGYNQTPEWMTQMREFKGIMNKLTCPWFPVAGNHDVYWRGPGKPKGEHEQNYEMHFGPLWYAFEHKDCWFVILYSDEGDPETGEKTFSKPEAQRVSPEQFAWLDKTLKTTAQGKHCFVFLHHPRWHGRGYGDDWERIHKRLAASGNVRVVFAGHEHRMVYDGKRDGIEYVCLATVGGAQRGTVPEAGWLHHFDIVTVRDDRISISALPVGAVMDPRKITNEVNQETGRLAAVSPTFPQVPKVSPVPGQSKKRLLVSYTNPTSRPVELTVRPTSADSRWAARPDHRHGTIEPGGEVTFEFVVDRIGEVDEAFRMLEIVATRDYLAEGVRIKLPEQRSVVPVRLQFPQPSSDKQRVLAIDGDDALVLPSGTIPLPQGAFTLEGWFKPVTISRRTGLVTKTENSEYGLFIINGTLQFDVHLDGKYVTARAEPGLVGTGKWVHIAGVFDGKELRLYLDGKLVGSAKGSGTRTLNGLPLVIGGDVAGSGNPTSLFKGELDDVRLTIGARYSGEEFNPARDATADDDTLLLLPMNGTAGKFHIDASPNGAHPIEYGQPLLQLAN